MNFSADVQAELTAIAVVQVVSESSAFVLLLFSLVIFTRLKLWREQGHSAVLLLTLITASVVESFALCCNTTWMVLVDNYPPLKGHQCTTIQCGVFTSLYVFSSTMELMLSLCIATDRMVALKASLFYCEGCPKWYIWLLLVSSTVISLAVALSGFDYVHATNSYYDSGRHGNFGGYTVSFTNYFYIAYAIMAFVTLLIYVSVLKFSRQPSLYSQHLAFQKQHEKRQRKITQFVTALMCAYGCTSFSGSTILSIAPCISDRERFIRFISWGCLLVYSNPLANFLVYAWKVKELRQEFYRLFCYFFKCRCRNVRVAPAEQQQRSMNLVKVQSTL